MKAKSTNSKLGGMVVIATVLTIFLSWGVASAADFHVGLDCTDCHDVSGASANISAIRDSMEYRGGPYPVTFLASPGDYATGTDDGVCEGCHYWDKAVHIDDMEGTPENDDCTSCHGTHCTDTPKAGDPGMFATPGLPDDAGHDLHYTMPGAKMAVALDCPDCHLKVGEVLDTSLFKDSEPLLTTNACDACHGGPGGAFPAVDGLNNADTGAKANWTLGIYEADGKTLQAGKGEWCATCHDNVPAHSRLPSETIEVIVDDADPDATLSPDCTPGNCDPYSEWQYWDGGAHHEVGLRYMAIKSLTPGGTIDGTATWTPNIPSTDQYKVYAWWDSDAYRSPSVTYTIYYNDGASSVQVTKNQRTGGGQWNYLDMLNFNAGTSCYVELTNDAPAGNKNVTWVIADAVKFVSAATDAPNVIGDNINYGYYKTGHGVNGIFGCLDCHDASKDHIDHKHRTYEANVTAYGDSYRLRDINGLPALTLPRPKRADPTASLNDFALCLDCHNPDEVIGENMSDKSHTNFKNDSQARNYHYFHLSGKKLPWTHFDSDRDGVKDSHGSCIACHNVHGAANQAMVRDGKLIDKEPALNFCYLTSEDLGSCNPNPTEAPLQLSAGSFIDPNGSTIAGNGICSMGCHTKPNDRPGSEDLIRTPYLGPKVINAKVEPETQDAGADVLVTAFVLDHSIPINISSVKVDLSPINGVEEAMNDDGINGDVTDNDGIYSCLATVPAIAQSGEYNLVVTAKDADDSLVGGKGTIELSVTGGVSGPIIIDDPDATINPDCTPGNCDPYSEWQYYDGGSHYGAGLRFMAIKSLTTPGGAIDGTATWTPNIPSTGLYKVSAWWDSDAYRSPSVTYTIYYNDGTDSVQVPADQTTAGGQWNYLDTLNFNAGTSCYVELSNDAPAGTEANTWVIADAIKFEPLGETYTISGQISTLDGVTVYLTGDSTDSTVTAGGGNYSFTVPDGNYVVTPSLETYEFVPASQDVQVSGGPEIADFVANWTGIVDDPEATFDPDCTPGNCDPYSEWQYYDGGSHYGAGLRFMAIKSLTTPGGAIDGTATWTPNIPSTGLYKVSAWWDSDAYRSPSVTYTIYYNDGTDSVQVPKNQRTGGGDWNELATLNFDAGTSCSVEVTNDAPAGNKNVTWVIADAIKWELQP